MTMLWVKVIHSAIFGLGYGVKQTYGGHMFFVATAWVCFLLLGAVLARIDIRERRLPNPIVGGLAACTVVLLSFAAWQLNEPRRILVALAAGFVLFLALLAMAVSSPSGLGMGDVKLGFVTGVMLGWLGWEWVFWGTFIGFTVGACWALILMMARRANRSTAIAFGPFLLLGVLVSGACTLI